MTRHTTFDIGIDVGGTFTDVVLVGSDGSVEVTKGLSTSNDQSMGAVDAASSLSVPFSSVRSIIHGTTVATNAILERRGARLALVCTRGFRDVLELQRQERMNIWDLYIRKVAPLVPRHMRFEVSERVGADGGIVSAIEEQEIEALADTLRLAEVDAVAVSFINAYCNPANEIAVLDILGSRLPGRYLVRSSAVAPHFREYERTSTTTISGYVGPKVASYLDRFAGRFQERRFSGRVFVMGSNGGVLPIDAAAALAATTCLSGPAGGVLACQRLSREKGVPDIISFDMGGTSTDVCLVADGRATVSTRLSIEDLPITLPMFAIQTVSAGGGSIASVDAGGMLQVGPESAGSMPGPACYGRGGTLPTVSDALCVTGLLRPDQFFDGRMALSRSAAEAAFLPLCDRLDLGLEAIAGMAIHIANVKMANAVRLVSVREGHDPRRFAIVAFGGAGPLHACSVAEEIGISHVIVPSHPGAFSAVGLLSANLRRDFVKAWPVRLSAVSDRSISAELAAFRSEVEREMAAVADGREVVWDCVADVRYAGQASELMVPVASTEGGIVLRLADRFHALHLAKYGYEERGAELEVMNLRLTGWAVVETAPFATIPARTAGAPSVERHPSGLPGASEIGFLERASLLAGDRLQGPLIVTEPTATTYVPPGWWLQVDPQGNLDLTRAKE